MNKKELGQRNNFTRLSLKRRRKLDAIFIIGIFMFVIIPSLASATLTDGLIGYWTMNETTGNAGDSSGLAHTFTQQGTVPSQIGLINNSRGTYSTANYFSQTGITFSSSGNYTFSTWIKFTSSAVTGQDIFDAFGSSGSLDIGLGFSNSKFAMSAWKNGQSVISASSNAITIDTNHWYHVVGTYSGNNGSMLLYVDGNFSANNTYTQGLTSTNNAYIDGCNLFSTDGRAYIDEVGLWNRTLSASEISQLYNNGIGLTYPFITTIYSIYGNITYNNAAFANATVQLMNSSGGFLAQTLSNSSGGYSFSGLSNASLYKVFAWFDNSTSDVSKNYFKVGEVYTTQSNNTLNLDFANVVSSVKTCQFSGSGIALSTITGCN